MEILWRQMPHTVHLKTLYYQIWFAAFCYDVTHYSQNRITEKVISGRKEKRHQGESDAGLRNNTIKPLEMRNICFHGGGWEFFNWFQSQNCNWRCNSSCNCGTQKEIQVGYNECEFKEHKIQFLGDFLKLIPGLIQCKPKFN